MDRQERSKKKTQEEGTGSVPHHWEPVPGQSLAAEEIRKKEEEEEVKRRKKKGGKN